MNYLIYEMLLSCCALLPLIPDHPQHPEAQHGNRQGTHPIGFKTEGERRFVVMQWERGQTWAVEQMELPIPIPITTLACLIVRDPVLNCLSWAPSTPRFSYRLSDD